MLLGESYLQGMGQAWIRGALRLPAVEELLEPDDPVGTAQDLFISGTEAIGERLPDKRTMFCFQLQEKLAHSDIVGFFGWSADFLRPVGNAVYAVGKVACHGSVVAVRRRDKAVGVVNDPEDVIVVAVDVVAGRAYFARP